jgi:signal transduction histidine kinase/Flp pilus assembly protein TadD
MRLIFTLLITILFFSCKSGVSVGPEDGSWADSAAEHAMKMMSSSKPEMSLAYLDSVYASRTKVSEQALWKMYHSKMNFYTYYRQDFKLRLAYIDSMISVSENNKEIMSSEYAQSLYQMASVLKDEQRYSEAFKYYYNGRSFALGVLDSCSLSDFSNALGIIRFRQGDFVKAIPYLRQALSEAENCKSSSFQYSFILPQSIRNSIGLCFEKSGQLDSAVHHYQKALQFILSQKENHPSRQDYITVARAVVEGNLGGAYASMGQFEEAEKHLKLNISLNDRPGFGIEDAQTAKVKLARLYLKINKTTHAKQILSELEQDLKAGRGKSRSHHEIWNDWYLLQSQYFEQKGDYSRAVHFMKDYLHHKDSLDFVQRGLKGIDVEELLRDQHKNFQLRLLQKDNELKSNYLTSLSIILVMAVGVAIVMYLNYRRSRKNLEKVVDLNAQLQKAFSALEISQKENTRIVKTVAHDLRGPLDAITSLIDIMLEEPGRSGDDAEVLNVIRGTSSHSFHLVDSLMHLNLTGKQKLLKEKTDLALLIKQCADMLSVRANEKNLKISLELATVYAHVNYEKMWRAVNNLITNAIKFSKAGTDIVVNLESSDTEIVLKVTDNGIGIAPEVGNQIFDAFTNARHKGTSGEESFGLGLSITKQIIEAHDGIIGYESELGKGTTFYVRIPKMNPLAEHTFQ